MTLPDGTCYIVAARVRSFNVLEKENDHYNFAAMFSTCVKINKLNFSLQNEIIQHFKLLTTVPIKCLTMKIITQSVEGVMDYKKNKDLFISSVKRLLSFYATISDCTINCSKHPLAKTLDIASLQIGSVVRYSPDSPNENILIAGDSNFIGHEFMDKSSLQFTHYNKDIYKELLKLDHTCPNCMEWKESTELLVDHGNNDPESGTMCVKHSHYYDGVLVCGVESVQCSERRVRDTLVVGGLEQPTHALRSWLLSPVVPKWPSKDYCSVIL